MITLLAPIYTQQLYKSIASDNAINQHMHITDPKNNIQYLDSEVKELLEARTRREIQDELGDVFYSACNVAFSSGFNWLDVFRMLNKTVKKVKYRLKRIQLNEWHNAYEMSWRQKWDACK